MITVTRPMLIATVNSVPCSSVQNVFIIMTNWKPNAGHQTLSLEEVANTAYQLPHAKPEATDNCTDHNKPLEIFCETCEELICHTDCTVRKHKDHDYDVVSDTYKNIEE